MMYSFDAPTRFGNKLQPWEQEYLRTHTACPATCQW